MSFRGNDILVRGAATALVGVALSACGSGSGPSRKAPGARPAAKQLRTCTVHPAVIARIAKAGVARHVLVRDVSFPVGERAHLERADHLPRTVDLQVDGIAAFEDLQGYVDARSVDGIVATLRPLHGKVTSSEAAPAAAGHPLPAGKVRVLVGFSTSDVATFVQCTPR